MKEKIEYPKFLYHHEQAPKIVKSKEEHEALGKEWMESPAEIEAAKAEEKAKAEAMIADAVAESKQKAAKIAKEVL